MKTDGEDSSDTGDPCSSAEHQSPQPPTSDINEILEAYMANERQQIEQAKRTLAVEVLPALLACGVSNIEIAYSGYGDSGAIDGVQFRDATGLRVVRDNIPSGVREKLETCAYAFLPAGFEDNDGGQGSLIIDLPSRRITLRHEENEVVSNDTTREWEV